jgi:hypothetical protein
MTDLLEILKKSKHGTKQQGKAIIIVGASTSENTKNKNQSNDKN